MARKPTFAKAQATDVYLFKGGGEGGGNTGLCKVWTKREDTIVKRESERRGEQMKDGQKKKTGKCPVCPLSLLD